MSQDDQQTPRDRQGRILLVLSAAAFMASLDLFIVNVAFDSIGRDFHGASLSDLSWILNGYAIAYAALLVPLGRLADRYGRKEGFLAGLALFALASAACALSPGLWWLVAFRVLQATGAAALTPTSLSLLLRSTPPDRRARAVRIWAATGALAAAIGPVVGGLLVQAAWQWVFVVNVPIAIVAIISTVRWVPDSRDASVERTPDLLGAGVLAMAIGALALSVVKGPAWGWSDARDVAGFVVAAVGIAFFAYRTARHPAPVVEPAMLAVRTFAWSNISSLVFSVAFGAGLLSTILWFQQVWGYGPVRSGLAIAPGPAMVQVTALISNRLARRGVPAGLIAALGCLMLAAGYVFIAFSVGVHPHWVMQMLPGQLLIGGGVGFALPTILSSGTSDLPPQRTATGSAVINMNRQIGTVLGVSILVAILGSPIGLAHAHHVFRLAWLTIAGIGVAGALVSVGITPSRRAVTTNAVPVAGDAA
ncbi:MFS transporter [Allobranchiibius sp. CTAmp26]|nr:MFS transporter [Allobranchiibius sp. CTAmp26]